MLEIAVSFFFGVKVNFDAVWTYVVSLTFGNVNGQMAMQPLSTMKSAFRMQYNLNHTFTRFIRAERSDSEFYKENVPISASFSLQKSPGGRFLPLLHISESASFFLSAFSSLF